MSLRNLHFLSPADPVVGNIVNNRVIVIVVGNDDDFSILLTRPLLNPHTSQLGISFDISPLCFAHSALAAESADTTISCLGAFFTESAHTTCLAAFAESAHTTISFLLNQPTRAHNLSWSLPKDGAFAFNAFLLICDQIDLIPFLKM